MAEGDRIRLCVSDTGIGMTKEQLTALIRMVDGRVNMPQDAADRWAHPHVAVGSGHAPRDNQHFGLSNVAERLRLNYGESSGLVFSSTYGEGTQVEITIPMIRGE